MTHNPCWSQVTHPCVPLVFKIQLNTEFTNKSTHLLIHLNFNIIQNLVYLPFIYIQHRFIFAKKETLLKYLTVPCSSRIRSIAVHQYLIIVRHEMIQMINSIHLHRCVSHLFFLNILRNLAVELTLSASYVFVYVDIFPLKAAFI